MPMKDFSKDRSEIPQFTIGDHTYTGLAGLPSGVMLKLASRFAGAQAVSDIGEQIATFREVIDQLLTDESATLFREMMESKDARNMVDFEQLEGAITWLMEVHGMRPMTLSEVSSLGPPNPESGTDWTGSTLAVESI
jgi:hypothetical protein